MPRSIALDVNMEIYKELILKVPLFKGVEIAFIRAIVKFTFPEFFMPGELTD